MSTPFLIQTQWISTEKATAVTNPFDGTLVGSFCMGEREHLDLAIESAHSTFEEVTRNQAPFERADILQAVIREIRADRDVFVDLLIREAGKPRVLAEGEFERTLVTFTLAAELARNVEGELLQPDGFVQGKGHMAFTRRFSIGVIYAITPFNFPLNLIAHKVAPALATGNTVLLKPSPRTTLIALHLVKCLLRGGMPAGQVNVVPCANEDAAYPLSDDRVKMLSFTGSSDIGWMLKQQCLRQKVALELGGNAAAIVHEDAPIELAVKTLGVGAFSNAGQSCISTQRILVHDSIYEDFKQQYCSFVREHVPAGDPAEPGILVGPMIDPSALKRTLDRLEAAKEEGATVLLGGGVNGQVLEPTVVEVPHQDMALCSEEAFAPVVTLLKYSDFETALDLVNDSRFGLQAGIFTRDIGRIQMAYERLDVGGVLINQAPTFRTEDQPYGGRKDSSFGREGVRYTMEEMTELKSLIIHNV